MKTRTHAIDHHGADVDSSAPRPAAGPLHDSPRMAAQRAQIDAAFGAIAQRQPGLEEEEPLQARSANSNGLPGALQAGIQALSGVDVSDVQVHRNSAQPAQLNALAYAQGSNIHLASGQEHHLPHEAWHVVQQRQGRVAPTMQLAGVGINDDASLEEEADAMGAKALQAAGRERGS